MIQRVTIIEILGRSIQGVTRPFLCRGDDGNCFWAKGSGAGKRALCSEWIAGRLAQKLGLPIPPFAQAIVPDELIKASPAADIHELGSGLVFASRDVNQTQELNWTDIRKIDQCVRQRILFFDWWIQNSDRTLTVRGGNPNILWNASQNTPWIIDHNLAFDDAFIASRLFESHVFAADRNGDDTEALESDRLTMFNMLAHLDEIYLEIPQEWRYLDADFSEPIDFNFQAVLNTINRINTEFERDWGALP